MNIEAIVIRKVPVREHDQIVVLYSKEIGKMNALARGSLRAHSKQALALDEGNRIQCELVSGKAGAIMTAAQAMCSHSEAKHSAVRWAGVQFFLQVVDALVYDEQPDAQLWSCLNDVLGSIDSATDADMLPVFRRCQANLLETLGYGTSSAMDIASDRISRCALDEQFEAIAQRRLTSLDLFYDVVSQHYS